MTMGASELPEPGAPMSLFWDTAAKKAPKRTPCAGGIHPPIIPAMDAEKLHWYPTMHAAMRVMEHTCNRCRDVSYEYGLIGGAYRIRRVQRRNGRKSFVHETPAVRRLVAAEWWRMVQAGEAV